ncbi:cytoplasmic polyadenylation element-binding protein 1-like [Tropilaelaps mercedesae]|uniref:Cytoplasmic polyadenylation element-binding protein 1-like n=1 Tax=Tropilaelaps mercedesae TaxID=418985 RepID=A0A1V9X8N1_9ACAR|nr:cytoplasmic polyadenylation element-binding protein 1-like [Tropilaelaps mercedesae]
MESEDTSSTNSRDDSSLDNEAIQSVRQKLRSRQQQQRLRLSEPGVLQRPDSGQSAPRTPAAWPPFGSNSSAAASRVGARSLVPPFFNTKSRVHHGRLLPQRQESSPPIEESRSQDPGLSRESQHLPTSTPTPTAQYEPPLGSYQRYALPGAMRRYDEGFEWPMRPQAGYFPQISAEALYRQNLARDLAAFSEYLARTPLSQGKEHRIETSARLYAPTRATASGWSQVQQPPSQPMTMPNTESEIRRFMEMASYVPIPATLRRPDISTETVRSSTLTPPPMTGTRPAEAASGWAASAEVGEPSHLSSGVGAPGLGATIWSPTDEYGRNTWAGSYTAPAPEAHFGLIEELVSKNNLLRLQEAAREQENFGRTPASRLKSRGLADLAHHRSIWREMGVELRKRQYEDAVYSTKVFVGNLPFDMSLKKLESAFRSMGVNRVHKLPHRGHAHINFQNSQRVAEFLTKCKANETRGWYEFKLEEHNLRVIPWALEEIEYGEYKPEIKYNIFVGALHGETTAEQLAYILDRAFGDTRFSLQQGTQPNSLNYVPKSIQYIRINTDKYKYPNGSARVQFATCEAFLRAINTRFLLIDTEHYEEKIQLEPYITEDAICVKCGVSPAITFCRKPTCFRFFCYKCFHNHRAPEDYTHEPVTRS